MYAIFQSGGKQYRVSEGQTIRLEKLNIATGNTVEFDKIMMINSGNHIYIGSPIVNNGKIIAKIVNHGRSDKLKIVKFRRRKHFRKHHGHRQWFTDVEVTSVSF
ncbi:50S ribosomal protein L21 [Candidatus Palibaumannia cicadellinicola]|uniref:Large ribosomal subunit protein bL21 n=1 Tax=Candidatus Palibaumannia cicadellinicola TaxID=186490 RepID=A0A0K2BLU5_9GAMM|nr:50S ribosomal protein L21 [Candidatus Baumannia cicadellinicola]AKZ66164.1 LSU ribosomal protein L21p [Candidatus Baumannia cicadellinicola]